MTSVDTFTGTRGHGSKRGKRESVIAALIAEKTHRDAAESARISISTLQRMLRNPEFREQYARAKRELVDATLMRLRVNGEDAAETLRAVAANPTPPRARLRGWRPRGGRPEFMFKAVVDDDIEARLRKIEEEEEGKMRFEDRLRKLEKNSHTQSVTAELADGNQPSLPSARRAGNDMRGDEAALSAN